MSTQTMVLNRIAPAGENNPHGFDTIHLTMNTAQARTLIGELSALLQAARKQNRHRLNLTFHGSAKDGDKRAWALLVIPKT